MAIFYDKKKKKWKVQIWHDGRRFKTKSFDKKAFADKFERESMGELDQFKLTGIQFKDCTYNELFDIWKIGASYRKRETSLVKDAQMHRDFVSPVIGKFKVSEIKPVHFESIVSEMFKKELTKSSVNKVIQHFKAVFNHSFNNETIGRNPGRSFKQLKIDTKEMDYFFQEELDDFLTYADRKYSSHDRVIYSLYVTLFLSGMRLGEVLGLEWEKFDFIRNTILIDQIWSSSEKSIVKTTKGKKDRLIPMPTIIRRELLSLRNRAKGNLVFSKDGLNPMDPSNLRTRYWNKDLENAEVRKIRMHDARHTYAALFMMSGGNLYELSKVLGHSNIKTTERYAHLSNAHLAGVRDIIKVNITPKAEVIELSQSSTLSNHSPKKSDSEFSAVNV